MAETVAFLTQRGIPVLGHIGLTPQSVNALGGFKTQGHDEDSARRLDSLEMSEVRIRKGRYSSPDSVSRILSIASNPSS